MARPDEASGRPTRPVLAALATAALLSLAACTSTPAEERTDQTGAAQQAPETTTTSTTTAGTLPIATSTSTSSTSSTTSTSLPPDELPVPVTALPAGFTLVQAAPAETVRVGQSWEYGDWTGLDLTKQAAVVALTHVVDPATGTTALLSSRWDTEAEEFTGTTELHRGRLSPTLAGTWPVAMASSDDALVGVVHENQDEQGRSRGITLHVSSDDGASWQAQTVTGEPASAPSAALHEGVAVVGYWQDGALVVATRDLSDDADWAPVAMPLAEGTTAAGAGPVVAVDATGRIGVVAITTTDAGGARRVIWWDGRSPTPVVIAELAPTPIVTPVPLALAFSGGQPLVAIGQGAIADRDGTTAALAVARSTDGGASFGAPEPIVADGPAAAPLAISLATTAAPVPVPAPIAATWVPDTSERGDCGIPKVAVAATPDSWTPCLENTPSRRVLATGLSPAAAYDADGRLNLVITVAASDGRLEPGVYLWRAAA